MTVFHIRDCLGEQVALQPRLGLYSVTDYMGQEMPGLASSWTGWAVRRRRRSSMPC